MKIVGIRKRVSADFWRYPQPQVHLLFLSKEEGEFLMHGENGSKKFRSQILIRTADKKKTTFSYHPQIGLFQPFSLTREEPALSP